MKTVCTLLITVFFFTIANAQETVGGKVIRNTKDQTYNRGEDKASETVDKALDKVEEGIGSIFKKKDKKQKNKKNNGKDIIGSSEPTNGSSSSTSNSGSKNIKVYSKFDFVPGEKIIGFDDFSTTNLGDFPLGWNTNSSAEVVQLQGSGQKWLFMTKDGYFQPEFVSDMPDNFTLEFDVFTRYRSNNILEYQLYLASSSNPKKDLSEEYLYDYIQLKWAGCEGSSKFYVVENNEVVNQNENLNIKDFGCGNEGTEPAFVRISIWRQNSRLRIYANENKVIDIPQAFNSKQKYNVFKLGTKYMNFSENENKDEFMVSNLRYAVGAPDTRSKLINDGKLVTRGILFDVNSDVIQASSYGVLKEIASALSENPTVNISIIGHTDSDGDAASNLTLSEKRAIAVKNILVSEFKIDSNRMQTAGKGETEPTDSNNTSLGKANNRRVEFIKL
ncbi:OmpA family protein [Aequorivita nionensis]|uniref:OmpA family protein n=1 Tax=Aequorivita nionensis TaxID=1287690 RepID=UPI003965C069